MHVHVRVRLYCHVYIRVHVDILRSCCMNLKMVDMHMSTTRTRTTLTSPSSYGGAHPPRSRPQRPLSCLEWDPRNGLEVEERIPPPLLPALVFFFHHISTPTPLSGPPLSSDGVPLSPTHWQGPPTPIIPTIGLRLPGFPLRIDQAIRQGKNFRRFGYQISVKKSNSITQCLTPLQFDIGVSRTRLSPKRISD
jgi:hypothetical protein